MATKRNTQAATKTSCFCPRMKTQTMANDDNMMTDESQTMAASVCHHFDKTRQKGGGLPSFCHHFAIKITNIIGYFLFLSFLSLLSVLCHRYKKYISPRLVLVEHGCGELTVK